MRLLDNLYTYIWQGNDNNCNSYLIADALKDRKHLLVDPGHITTPFYHEVGLDRLFREMEEAADALSGDLFSAVSSLAHTVRLVDLISFLSLSFWYTP